jgi:mRNA-degrading endonuclease toxin of MazEF toxin-antitoxin module
MRERRQARGLRELRLVVPDARSKAIRRRVARAAAGDYGKLRPAVIVQTDAFPASHASVVVCQMTSDCSDAPDFRVTVDPTATNGCSGGRRTSRHTWRVVLLRDHAWF